jgi:hypothetical protein
MRGCGWGGGLPHFAESTGAVLGHPTSRARAVADAFQSEELETTNLLPILDTNNDTNNLNWIWQLKKIKTKPNQTRLEDSLSIDARSSELSHTSVLEAH